MVGGKMGSHDMIFVVFRLSRENRFNAYVVITCTLGALVLLAFTWLFS